MKPIIIFILILFVSPLSFASHLPFGEAGCGLGSLLFEGKNELAPQVMASITNSTSGSQTFGISTGTSNCTDEGTVRYSKATTLFIETNSNALAKDSARGGGESIHHLAQLMGCPDADYLGSVLKTNYAKLFDDNQQSGAQLAKLLLNSIQCSKIY